MDPQEQALAEAALAEAEDLHSRTGYVSAKKIADMLKKLLGRS